MLVGYAEALGTAKTYAQRSGGQIDPNRELVGLGAANLGAGISGGFAVNGSLSKTAVNNAAGGRDPGRRPDRRCPDRVHASLLTGYFESLPIATLAAVVIAALIKLIDPPALRDLYRVYSSRARSRLRLRGARGLHRRDRGHARSHASGHARRPLAGVLISLLAPRLPGVTTAADGAWEGPRVSGQLLDLDRHPQNTRVNGVVVLSIEGGLFFANASPRRRAAIRRAGLRDAASVSVMVDAGPIRPIDGESIACATRDGGTRARALGRQRRVRRTTCLAARAHRHASGAGLRHRLSIRAPSKRSPVPLRPRQRPASGAPAHSRLGGVARRSPCAAGGLVPRGLLV